MSYTSPDERLKTFRTVDGFKRWCCDWDIPGGVGTEYLYNGTTRIDDQFFAENHRGELLVVTFNHVTGKVKDAMVHREHVTHMLGSNTFNALLAVFKNGNKPLDKAP